MDEGFRRLCDETALRREKIIVMGRHREGILSFEEGLG